MIEFISQPWPWYVAGPIIGLMVPLLLLLANKPFGISSNFRHICAACIPGNIKFFQYNWRANAWNLFFALGVVIGGFIAAKFFNGTEAVAISDKTHNQLEALGVSDYSTIIPLDIFTWENLATVQGFVFMVIGGFLVGFGTRYANGCTSGHSIMGLSNLQRSSLIATVGFFIGGLVMTHLILPLIM